MPDKIWYIKNTGELFAHLGAEELKTLAGISRMVKCPRNHQFYLSDDASDALYLVKKGRVRLGRVTARGDEITLDVLGPGELFGERSLTDEGQRSHFAEATEETLVCIFPRAPFQAFLADHPELTFKLMKIIGLRFQQLETRLEDLTFQPLAERLRTTLVQLAEKHGVQDHQGTFRMRITQKDIAYLVGATRESVAEELGRMKQAGLVSTGYRSVQLHDLDALRPGS